MRKERIGAGLAVVLGALVIAGALVAVLSGGHRAVLRSHATRRLAPTSTSLSPAGSWHVVAPPRVAVQETPVQQRYDSQFEQGFASASNRAVMDRAAALSIPLPAIEGGWPDLRLSQSPDSWTVEFVTGLLDINFARESRDALGAWLVAEEAPDLMPGIEPAVEDRALYVSLLAPGITGQPSPLPSPSEWQRDAAAGVTWSVSDLEVQLEPQWQQMIDAGWEPPDIRSCVEDVSGVLSIRRGTATTTRRFSMVVQVGSSHWRDGYGTVFVSSWTVF